MIDTMHVVNSFHGFLLSKGIQCDINDIKHDVSGFSRLNNNKVSYWLRTDGKRPNAFVENFVTGDRFNWTYESKDGGNTNYTKDKSYFLENQKRKEEEQKLNLLKAKVARDIWRSAPEVVEHSYLTRKKVGSHGLRYFSKQLAYKFSHEHNCQFKHLKYSQGALIAPIFNFNLDIIALQFILDRQKPNKFFHGSNSGGFFPIYKTDNGKMIEQGFFIVVEGVATGFTIHEITGLPVFIAYGKGNLEKIAVTLKARNPNKTIIVAADNDYAKEKNEGLEIAKKIKDSHGIDYLFPSFDKDSTGSDFNDLFIEKGPLAVKQVFDVLGGNHDK